MIPYAYIRARSIVLPSGEVLGRQCRRLGKQFDDFRPQRVTAAFIPCNVYAKHWVSQLRRERGQQARRQGKPHKVFIQPGSAVSPSSLETIGGQEVMDSPAVWDPTN